MRHPGGDHERADTGRPLRRHAPRPLFGDWSPEPALDGELVKPSDETISVLAQRGYLVALTRKIEAAHGIPENAVFTRRLTFFGGEPLLAGNRPVIEHFITRLREMGKASFTAVSNASRPRPRALVCADIA